MTVTHKVQSCKRVCLKCGCEGRIIKPGVVWCSDCKTNRPLEAFVQQAPEISAMTEEEEAAFIQVQEENAPPPAPEDPRDKKIRELEEQLSTLKSAVESMDSRIKR